ncbi:MAG TPA: hypothetical protein VG273_04830 [Bryobacteraceae bacterium]|jgi:hypothetical protein|nr:hypothetical protein [Bryobacteraceae bacterium]
MSRLRILTAALLLIPGLQLQAVIVDGIAIAVGNKVITRSDIEQRIRLTALQNGETPDFSLASRKLAAQRLIDQRLIEKEMEVGRFPHTPEARARELLANYEKTSYGSDPAALRRALEKYGLTEKDLEEDLARQADLLTFLNLRFRPAVNVDDREVQAYFDQKVSPEEKKQGLNALRTQIEQLLANDRADRDLDEWLKDQRGRTRIDYVDKELAPAERKIGGGAAN